MYTQHTAYITHKVNTQVVTTQINATLNTVEVPVHAFLITAPVPRELTFNNVLPSFKSMLTYVSFRCTTVIQVLYVTLTTVGALTHCMVQQYYRLYSLLYFSSFTYFILEVCTS